MGLLRYLSLDATTILTVLTSSALVAILTVAIHRLFFHPLSQVPGPKLAAITYLYEYYWDVIQPGRLTWHLQDLHDQYGPIVRICPDEVHIRDSSYFDELYARSTGKRDKLPRFSGRFGFQSDAFSTWQHDVHRMRRTAINPFFSVQKVTALQPVIRNNLTKLTKVLAKAADAKTVVPINLAYMALTGDITQTYAFAQSDNQLDSPNFQTTYDDTFKTIYTVGNVTVHFPIIFTLIDACPPWLTRILNPAVMPIVNFRLDRERDIREIRTGINDGHKSAETQTIFHEMLQTPVLPPHEKTDRRLRDEAIEIVAAGIITTSWSLTVGTYHISTNAQIQQTLHHELQTHLPHPLNLQHLQTNAQDLDWHTLERLPYLSACIRESIRLAGGVLTRAPRIAPDEPITYKSHTIPPGYAISMTTWHIAHDPSIFPSPETFRPERWIRTNPNGNIERNTEMDRWVVAFGKGPRQCAGINLAFAEMYIIMACMFRSFEWEVCGGTEWERDVKVSHAYMVPYPDFKSPGVKVRVKRVDE